MRRRIADFRDQRVSCLRPAPGKGCRQFRCIQIGIVRQQPGEDRLIPPQRSFGFLNRGEIRGGIDLREDRREVSETPSPGQT